MNLVVWRADDIFAEFAYTCDDLLYDFDAEAWKCYMPSADVSDAQRSDRARIYAIRDGTLFLSGEAATRADNDAERDCTPLALRVLRR